MGGVDPAEGRTYRFAGNAAKQTSGGKRRVDTLQNLGIIWKVSPGIDVQRTTQGTAVYRV